jgi:bifunctional DNA-binding transcriptional regulator/antitoxin component of YhaV-PrlF toxin-antitoxin module
VAEKKVVDALDWAAGDRLTVTAEGTSVIILRRDSRGPDTLISKERIRLPISLRIRCGIQVGDRVLLAATRELDLLLAYPLSTVERALAGLHQDAAEVEL